MDFSSFRTFAFLILHFSSGFGRAVPMPTLWTFHFRHPFIRCLSLYARFGKCNDCVLAWYVENSSSRPVPTQLKLHFLSSTNSFLANMGHLGLGAVVRNSTESRVPKLGRATQPIPSAHGFQQFSHFCIFDFGLKQWFLAGQFQCPHCGFPIFGTLSSGASPYMLD